jgi:ketopantoate reductase
LKVQSMATITFAHTQVDLLTNTINFDRLLIVATVVKTIEETSGAFDFIVFTHKALGQDSVPMGLARVTNPQTSIIIMQNGVGNEEPFRKELPGNTILTCSVCNFCPESAASAKYTGMDSIQAD